MKVVVTRVDDNAINVGRPTPLGNPFYMHSEKDRDTVCDKYEIWFKEQLRLREEVFMYHLKSLIRVGRETGQIRLGCYCSPKRCHADTIARFLNHHFDKESK